MQVTFGGKPLTVLGTQFKVGDVAPNFTATKTDLSHYTLADAKDTIKIISVVPSIDTPVCSIQTKRFNKEASGLNGVTIITISLDLPFAMAKWCAAEQVNEVVLASDYKDRDFGKKYSLLIDELKLLTRAILVLNKNNVIKYTEYLSEITNEPNYDEAIKQAKALL